MLWYQDKFATKIQAGVAEGIVADYIFSHKCMAKIVLATPTFIHTWPTKLILVAAPTCGDLSLHIHSVWIVYRLSWWSLIYIIFERLTTSGFGKMVRLCSSWKTHQANILWHPTTKVAKYLSSENFYVYTVCTCMYVSMHCPLASHVCLCKFPCHTSS